MADCSLVRTISPNVYDSLNWIESFESGRIQPLTGVFKYTIDGVEYSTSNGQTAYKYYGVLEEAE